MKIRTTYNMTNTISEALFASTIDQNDEGNLKG